MRHYNLSFIFTKPTPYHDTLLNYFNNNPNITVKVYYLKRVTYHHPWEIDDKAHDSVFINNTKILINSIHHLIKDKPDLVIVAGFFNPTFLLFIINFKLFNIRFANWGDVPRIKKKRSWVKSNIRMVMLRWLYKNAAAILTMGQVGIDAYTTMGFPSKKVRNLPLIVDPDEPIKLGSDIRQYAAEIKAQFAGQGEVIFLCAGMLVPQKKYDLAVRAFCDSLSLSCNQKSVMLIAGEGPEKNNLRDLAANLGIGNKVHFLGWCQPEQMKGLYYVADVLVHPSAWDAYGAVILEAMAWGLPVLASDQTMAALDRIVPGESGFIHKVGDITALANHMKYFLDDPARIPLLGAKARATAEQWPVSRCVQPIMDLL